MKKLKTISTGKSSGRGKGTFRSKLDSLKSKPLKKNVKSN